MVKKHNCITYEKAKNMIVKQVNLGISIASRVMRYFIIFYSAVLLAKFVLWVFTPNISEIYHDKFNLLAFETSGKFIMNRAPFGVILAPPPDAAPPVPTIVSQMKLTGVYVNTLKNSMAFYELDKKSYIAKIGDTIGSSAVLKSISANGIVVSENGLDGEVKMSGGDGTAQAPTSQSNTNNSVFNNSNYQPPAQNNSNPSMQNQQNEQQPDDFAERRRKLMEEFTQRRSDTESPNKKGYNNGQYNH